MIKIIIINYISVYDTHLLLYNKFNEAQIISTEFFVKYQTGEDSMDYSDLTKNFSIEINSARVFNSVIETRNFTKTAELLGYTQSAVSQIIKKLEKQLGLTLFIRGKRKVFPTSSANELVPIMRDLIKAEDSLIQKSQKLQNIMIGTLRIGTFASVSNHILSRTLHDFLADYPSIKIELNDSYYWDIGRLLQNGELDLGFIIVPTNAIVDYKVITPDPYRAVLPKNHPLADLDVIPLKKLIKEPFIIPSDNLRSEVGEYINDNNLTINKLFRVKDDYVTTCMVANNVGVTVLPDLVLSDFKELVEIRPIDPPIQRRLAIAVNSFDTCTPVCKEFLKYLFKTISSLGM